MLHLSSRLAPAPTRANSHADGQYDPYDFANRRHIGPSVDEIARMLEVVGAESLDALIDETLPAGIRQKKRPSSAPPCRSAGRSSACAPPPTRTSC